MTRSSHPPNDSDNENTSLLPAERRPPLTRVPSSSIIHPTHSPRIIVAIVITIVFVISLGLNLIQVPSWRLYEDIICHHYYNTRVGEGHIGFTGRIDESLCKGEEVQAEVNVIIAGQALLSAVASFTATIPYGLLADRIGRKPIFVLAIFGWTLGSFWEMVVMRFWMVIPIRLLWLSPIFTLIGGGSAVFRLAFFAIISDVIKDTERANVFFFSSCSSLLGELTGPTLASTLMDITPWLPIMLGNAITVLAIILSLFIPETLHMHIRSSRSEDNLTPDNVTDSSLDISKPTFLAMMKNQGIETLKHIHGSMSIVSSPRIILLLICFIIMPFNEQCINLSPRYISNRFSWTLRQAGFVLSMRALMNILLLLLILPSISKLLTTTLEYTTRSKDLFLARISIMILGLGALLMAASPTVILTIIGLAIHTLGTGFIALVRSLITGLVNKEHVARLYAAIALVEMIGALIAGPSLAFLYTKGLRWGGEWVGLPFFLLSGVCVVAGTSVWGFGVIGGKRDGERESDEEEVR